MKIETIAEYTVRHTNYGILIFGRVPITSLSELCEVYNNIYGYDMLDAQIAQHYRAAICFTTMHFGNLWRIDLELEEIRNPEKSAT